MELTKTKLKQTELGLIPEDWQIETFKYIADRNVKNSITGGPFGSNLKTEDYTLEGVQIIQLQNIGDGNFIDDSVIYTSENKANELKSCNIYPGEIILSKMGDPVARACIMPFKATRYLMASDGIRLVVDEKNYDKQFVFHYINSNYFRNRAIEISTGSTRQRIGLPDLKSLKFIKPPLSEQKAIATALSDVDALISSLERLITKKKAIKQGAMQELLTPPQNGGKRLPGFSEEWEEKTLGEIITDFQNGYAFSASGYKEEGIPIVTMAQIGLSGQFQFDENKVNYWSLEELKNLKSFTLFIGDLIISMTDVTPEKNLIGRMAIVNESGPLFLNQRVGHLRINKDLVNPVILKHLSNMRSWRTYSKAIASLGVQANIGTTDIKNGTFWLPKIDEQNAIAQILSDMDAEIEALEAKKTKYQGIKQGMMQELLTGKTRLV